MKIFFSVLGIWHGLLWALISSGTIQIIDAVPKIDANPFVNLPNTLLRIVGVFVILSAAFFVTKAVAIGITVLSFTKTSLEDHRRGLEDPKCITCYKWCGGLAGLLTSGLWILMYFSFSK